MNNGVTSLSSVSVCLSFIIVTTPETDQSSVAKSSLWLCGLHEKEWFLCVPEMFKEEDELIDSMHPFKFL